MAIYTITNAFRAHYGSIKRCMDFAISGALLILLCPLFLGLVIAVKTTSSGGVFFWSERVGLNGNTFQMPKFRSMTSCSKVMSREIATDADIKLSPIGNFIRKLSLDELPQLWSVFKGDMSLIGPRPLLTNDYANAQRQVTPAIYSVKPGITGLAQVNGRSFITPRNKVKYDLFYAQRVCMILDFKIAFKTIGTVLNTDLVK